MTRKALQLTVVLLLLVSAPALASGFGLYGSYWDTDELGETAGAGAKLALGGGTVRFELRGSYFPDLSEDFDDLVEDGDLEVGDFELTATAAEAGLTFQLASGSALNPYLGAGVSYYFLDAEVAGLDVELDDEVGFYGLFGIELGGRGGRGPAFFAEALYRSVEGTVDPDDDDVDFDEEVDLDLSGLAVNAGVVFRY